MKRFDRTLRTRANGRSGAERGEPSPFEITLTVKDVGARGDGLAEGPAGAIYVPFSLPGEVMQARVTGDRAETARLVHPSSERVDPACSSFGRCGGCQLQHWADGPYLAWKHNMVVQALAKRGLDTEIRPIRQAWGLGRRRAGFHAARIGREARFGFIQRGGASIEPIQECPLLEPALQSALPALKRLSATVTPERGDLVLQCLATPQGIDVDIKGAGRIEALRTRLPQLSQAAIEADLARLSLEGEPVVVLRPPILAMGTAQVQPPPGCFVQPTDAGEACLAELVLGAAAGGKRFADLFCGIGTFGLRLAQLGDVLAVEGDDAMLSALQAAADKAGGGLHTVTTMRRDLLRTPLSALELKRVDVVVMDPPRSGARLQAEQIAASRVERVISVSCDAATFARDSKVLIDRGFKLNWVTPLDQFRWSPHVEMVGVFER